MPTGDDNFAYDLERKVENLKSALYEEMYSSDPNSVGRRTLVEILESPQIHIYGIRLIVNDQLWENQINRYGQKLPLYKPDTIRKKAKLGHPADKLVNYTNYWTGAFADQGVTIEVNQENDWFDFIIVGKWASFIPEDRVGLTDENEAKFRAVVQEEWKNRMSDWFINELMTRDLDDYA